MSTSSVKNRCPDPASWLKNYGDYLYSFAIARLRDPDLAEDAVQETLFLAYRGRERFRGRSSFRTWLTAILKHQVAEIFRKRARIEQMEADAVLDRLFDEKGKWRTNVATWKENPVTALQQREFLGVLLDCMRRLPERMGDAFSLRIFHDADAEEVAHSLRLKANHVLVLMHRARIRMWNCLSRKWFQAN